MVEVRFRIRNTVFNAGNSNRRTTIRPITFQFPTLEEAALLASIDDAGTLVPREKVFALSRPRSGPVIEGFVDCALGEFVRAQLEALSSDGLPPAQCEVHGLEPFMESFEPDNTERLRDLISVCEFRANEFTPESAVRFLKDTGFFDQYIIIGVKHGKGWRRSRCITTFEGRPADAGAILGHLADYFGKAQDGPLLEAEAAEAPQSDEWFEERGAEHDECQDEYDRQDDESQDGYFH
jgi:hypothetical protein